MSQNDKKSFGVTSAPSTSRNVKIVALVGDGNIMPVIGKLAFFDTKIDGKTYRAIGTISDIETGNQLATSGAMMIATAKGGSNLNNSTDIRTTTLSVQAVFLEDEGEWKQHGSALPNSPSTSSPLFLLDADNLDKMLANTSYPSIGFFRGLKEALPLNLPDFASNRGATHSSVIGKSGSGKHLSLNTTIPTPMGCTTMGELKEGDQVFNEFGEPITVLQVHEIITDATCYNVVFSDGSIIEAGSEHLWYTETSESRKSGSARTASNQVNAKRKSVLTHEQISSLRGHATEIGDKNITVQDAAKLIGLGKAPKWFYEVASQLKVEGYVENKIVSGYSTEPFTNKKVMSVFNKKEILSATLENKNKTVRFKSDPSLEQKLSSVLATTVETEQVTLREYAEIIGSPVRSGALRKFVNILNVEEKKEIVEYVSKGANYASTLYQFDNLKVALYNKNIFLNKLAEYGSRLWHDQMDNRIVGSVKTTQEIKDSLTNAEGRWNHSIPVAKAVQYTEKDLLIEPYLFGVWLGDGHSSAGKFCGIDEEIKDEVVSRGGVISRLYIHNDANRNIPLNTWTVEGLAKNLRKLGVLKTSTNGIVKNIPEQYLYGSIQQRRDLLAGLMDTDGNATKSASVEFTNTNKNIADGVLHLALSLGYRATINEGRATLNGVDYGPKWTVRWSTKDDVFLLPRKVESHRKYSVNFNEYKNNQRYIVAVDLIDTIPMRCITVSGESALYLAGDNFIPTHNTALATYLLAAQMKFENHAIVVIDPQGQWNNENGFLFSPQEFARGLGRPVTALRVAEDIKLPRNVDVLTSIIDKTNLWARFRRMGSENKEMFSREVAERFAFINKIDREPRSILEDIFGEIAESPSTLGRIYTKGERQDGLRDTLLQLAGLDPIPSPEEVEAGLQPQWTDEDLKDTEQTWASILTGFAPIHSLFSSTNFNGGKRRALGGDQGFLSEILQVRGVNPRVPAPYVVLDMSPNTALHAKAALSKDKELGMQKLLDNQDIKAIILMVVLEELKKAAEVAFSIGGGNLNTQIVFDEAWRYAPERSESEEITKLATMLEGFALDTRKFGIGWTYILQSPGDLRSGIWKQLTFVYSGYGLVGEDVKRLEGLTDDPKQVDLYRQFISPASTGIYPFMINGPISPLIFTSSPTFVNVYSDLDDFLLNNSRWITAIVQKRQMPMLTNKSILRQVKSRKDLVGDKEVTKKYGVGKTIPRPDMQTFVPETDVEVVVAEVAIVDDKVISPPPF